MSKPTRQSAPATARNRQPILEVMRRVFPREGRVLEIASGTGEHAAFFSACFPELVWQPSDVGAAALASIQAWREEGSANLRPPIRLDVRDESWPVDTDTGIGIGIGIGIHTDIDINVIVNINMIHISPWEACQGLMSGAGRVLAPGGLLLLYGPYRLGGQHTAPSNESFDASLRERDPSWGVRDLDAVIAEAERAGLAFSEKVAMPANNFTVLFRHI